MQCGCFTVSHNSTTVGQHVQPSCSLSGHRVRWYRDLIHFALTLSSKPFCLFVFHPCLHPFSWKLHFCRCVNVWWNNTHWAHPWDRYFGSKSYPQTPADSLETCRSWQRGVSARHVGQLVYRYCSASWFVLLFPRPGDNVGGSVWLCKSLCHLNLASWNQNHLIFKSGIV